MLWRLAECVAVQETYFFRDKSVFECFEERVLPSLLEARQTSRRLRIWCAGCSTGQEPYAIAMALAEKGDLLQGWEIEILPSTLSPREKELTAPGYSHVGLVVDDFEKTSRFLASKGVSLHDVRSTSNGWTIGYFEDPEGNVLEVVYRPAGG